MLMLRTIDATLTAPADDTSKLSLCNGRRRLTLILLSNKVTNVQFIATDKGITYALMRQTQLFTAHDAEYSLS